MKIIGNSQFSAWAYFRYGAYTSEVPAALPTASLSILFEADFFGSLSGNLPRGGLRGTRKGGLVQMLLERAADTGLTAPPPRPRTEHCANLLTCVVSLNFTYSQEEGALLFPFGRWRN